MEETKPSKGKIQTSQSCSKSYETWIVEQLTILAEAFGEALSNARVKIYLSDLSKIPQAQLGIAFNRARTELKFFPKIAEILDLAGTEDGRPSPEEAWSMCPKSEEVSCVWTTEMQEAFSFAYPLLGDGDSIGARMAFKESYAKQIEKGRRNGSPVRWQVSLGYDKLDRVRALAEAVQLNRITADHAYSLVDYDGAKSLEQALPMKDLKQLPERS